ncbi:hypothetical protein MAM1_0227d08354, partial [Mucor ambiguus]
MSNNSNPGSPVAAPAQVPGVRDIQLEQRTGAASQPDSPISQEDAEMADAEST